MLCKSGRRPVSLKTLTGQDSVSDRLQTFSSQSPEIFTEYDLSANAPCQPGPSSGNEKQGFGSGGMQAAIAKGGESMAGKPNRMNRNGRHSYGFLNRFTENFVERYEAMARWMKRRIERSRARCERAQEAKRSGITTKISEYAGEKSGESHKRSECISDQ